MNKYYFHFTSSTLRDGRPIPPIGEWLHHDGPIVPCKSGLHASVHPFDALKYAPGPMLHLVELDGEIIPHEDDKVVAPRRRIIATIDATELLRGYARWCALQVIDKWDAPDVVRRYLETGDDSLRDEARAAAWTAEAARAARAAARAAAWAVWTAEAAVEAAVEAAEAAVEAAWTAAVEAAWTAAVEAAWTAWSAEARAAEAEAARKAQREHFLKLVTEAFSQLTII